MAPGAHPPLWLRIAAFVALAVGLIWAIGRTASRRIEEDNEIASQHSERSLGVRPRPRVAVNAKVMSMGWVANLDGTAVAYATEADGLMSPDGQFKTDLSADEAAKILHIDATTIAKKGAPHEIDPGAVLFRAQAGTLTDRAKAISRERRREQVANGRTPDMAYGEWDVQNFAFTLGRLKNPDEKEKAILEAISRSNLLIVPRPGDTIRATPINRGDLEPGLIALWPGMLPPEEPASGP